MATPLEIHPYGTDKNGHLILRSTGELVKDAKCKICVKEKENADTRHLSHNLAKPYMTPCCEICKCPNDCGQPGPHCKWIKDGKPDHFCHTPAKSVTISHDVLSNGNRLLPSSAKDEGDWRTSLRKLIREEYNLSDARPLDTFIEQEIGRAEGRANENGYKLGVDVGLMAERERLIKLCEGLEKHFAPVNHISAEDHFNGAWNAALRKVIAALQDGTTPPATDIEIWEGAHDGVKAMVKIDWKNRKYDAVIREDLEDGTTTV